LNKDHESKFFTLRVDGLVAANVHVVGAEAAGQDDTPVLNVPADKLRSFRVYVTAPRSSVPTGLTNMRFTIKDRDGESVASYQGSFRGPGRE